MRIIFAILFVLSLLGAAYGEMPESPNFEELCEHSKVVICGEPIKKDKEVKTINKRAYSVITFKVHKVYKGRNDVNDIAVLIPMESSFNPLELNRTDLIIPVYDKGEKYFLFLRKRLFSEFYFRIKIDDIWGAREWNEDKEQQIIEE